MVAEDHHLPVIVAAVMVVVEAAVEEEAAAAEVEAMVEVDLVFPVIQTIEVVPNLIMFLTLASDGYFFSFD